MKLNLFNLLYFGFRMIPFVLVTYFLMQAIFLQDFKALIFLGGLLLAVFVAVIAGSLLSAFNLTGKPDTKSVCSTIPLFDDGPVSRLPLSTVVLTYTLCYFSIPIMHYQRELSNLPILVVFPILIFFDMMWLYNFGCSSALNIFAAGVVGMKVGFIWSELIFITNLRQVQYFSILSHKELCSIPSTVKYQCNSSPSSSSSSLPSPPSLSLSMSLKNDIVQEWTDLQATPEATKLQQTVFDMGGAYPDLQDIVNNMYLSSTVANYLLNPKRFLTLPGGATLMNQWNQAQTEDANEFSQQFAEAYALPAYTQLLTDTKAYVDKNPTAAAATNTAESKVIRMVSIIEIINAGLS